LDTLGQKRTPALGLRSTYVLLSPKRSGHKLNWNIYCGLSGMAYFGPGAKPKDDVEFKLDPLVGARYALNRKWFLWLELSYRTASLGLAFKI